MNIEIKDFSGPLDLLLHLVKINKMDIYDINIEVITKEYIDYINSNKDLTIDACSEYLVMASELIHLKSKLLINNNSEENDDTLYEIDSQEDLQNRLLEYQKLKELTDDFRSLEEKRSEVYTKLQSNLDEYTNTKVPLSEGITLDDLLSAFEMLLKRKQMKEPINTTVTKRELSVEKRIVEIKNVIKKKGKVSFFELFEEITKPYVIVTFLSILNMCKNNEVIITQKNNFGEIYIEGR